MSLDRLKDEVELESTYEEELLDRARKGMLGFTVYTKPNYYVNWHHRVMCEKLDKFARKEITRLMIFMPPRNGKTELGSRHLPAFIFGENPSANIIAASYSAELASKNNRDVQRIMDLPEYKQVFPQTMLSSSEIKTVGSKALRNSDMFETIGFFGTYRSAGVGGGITGMGADFLIIDDPYKNSKEADSPTVRESVWDWWTSTAFTRLEENGSVLLIMTRWHQDDLAGRLLKQAEAGETAPWDVVSFQAIKEQENKDDPREFGDPLWPKKYPLDKLMEIKTTVGSRNWNALYQQNPSDAKGAIIKREWTNKRWRILPDRFDEELISLDCSFKDTKSSSYVVGQVWGRVGSNFYLRHQKRDQLDFVATKQLMRDLHGSFPKAHIKLVEDKANGPAIISDLKNEIPGMIPVLPEGSKQARLSAVSPFFEAGNVWLPDSSVAPWVGDYVEELVSFPLAANDDQVDATSQALQRFKSGHGQFSASMIPETSTIAGGDNEW